MAQVVLPLRVCRMEALNAIDGQVVRIARYASVASAIILQFEMMTLSKSGRGKLRLRQAEYLVKGEDAACIFTGAWACWIPQVCSHLALQSRSLPFSSFSSSSE